MCQKKRNHMQLYNSDILAVPSICIHTTFLYVNRCKYICIYVHIYKKNINTHIYIYTQLHTYIYMSTLKLLFVGGLKVGVSFVRSSSANLGSVLSSENPTKIFLQICFPKCSAFFGEKNRGKTPHDLPFQT